MTEVRRTEVRRQMTEDGLRPIGAIRAYAPEGRRKGEGGKDIKV